MLYVCHRTPTQSGSVCMGFVKLGHHKGRLLGPKMRNAALSAISRTQRPATSAGLFWLERCWMPKI